MHGSARTTHQKRWPSSIARCMRTFWESLRRRRSPRGTWITPTSMRGARAAAGDILAFLDADCLAPEDWLNRILELANADGAGVLGAHYLLTEDSTWVGRTWHRYQEAPKSGEVSHVPAGDLIMRREDF